MLLRLYNIVSIYQELTLKSVNYHRLAIGRLRLVAWSTYTIKATPETDPSKDHKQPDITTTLVAIDPHPQHGTYVELMQKTLSRMKEGGSINDKASVYIMSHSRRALKQLPQRSQLVNDALLPFSTPREVTITT